MLSHQAMLLVGNKILLNFVLVLSISIDIIFNAVTQLWAVPLLCPVLVLLWV